MNTSFINDAFILIHLDSDVIESHVRAVGPHCHSNAEWPRCRRRFTVKTNS
jgi:hypothetical protein